MLKNKRVVVTGGGRDFGQAVSVWLAREGAHVDLCARQLDSARATCEIIQGEGGSARAYACDIADARSVRAFAEQLQADERPVDILVLSAAQWLEGPLGEGDSDEEIVSTINSGLTGSITLTRALLPSLRRSGAADIMAMVSVCGVPQFTNSIAHPAFFAAKHGMSGFCQNMTHHLAAEGIRVTGFYPPDFEVTSLDETVDPAGRLLNGRSIWETMRFVLAQPRSCHIDAVHFRGPTRQDLT
ncbi:SDR family oxidoreductase [Pseudomonas entomophila]|uniref:SDR family oxidoreductase n=2 Tax=Pseudomonas entomophila TaxID=312306 RepID=A0ABY9QML8_9PSED|nr:SDR family oxidoreductase [Pseudomonas entomophila]WMW05288.1 SDR family oxidoreductase [Pseudomonas entomophila]CAK13883.1 putative dehydrogenase [Pseudomonas entomophila L48]